MKTLVKAILATALLASIASVMALGSFSKPFADKYGVKILGYQSNAADFNQSMELAEKVIELTESKSRIVFQGLPSDDPKQRKPDITLAKNLLGWKPSIELDEGLISTIEYFRTLIQEPG